MLYQPKAAEVKAFVRGARKVEKMLECKSGSQIDPTLALQKIDEIIASAKRTEIVPPPGGRIHIVRVPVIQDEPWADALKAAGPNTPSDYNVWKVGDLYPPAGVGVTEQEFVLMNFGSAKGSFDRSIAWAAQYRELKRSAPRGVFAIGRHKPQLHRELEMDPMYAIATEECSFSGYRQAPRVWWLGSERWADVHWIGHYGIAYVWFVFRRE